MMAQSDAQYAAGAPMIAARLAKSRVDESYHFSMLDQPDVFLREVDVFLRSQ